MTTNVVLVTGAGSGIGRATASTMARHGWTVWVADIDGDSAASVADEIECDGGRALAAACDVADEAQLVELVARDLLDDLTARHHEDAVAEPGELEGVARLHEHRGTGLRAGTERLVDVEPRADVDYVSIAHPRDLTELDTVDPAVGALASLAVRIGATRLIDNELLADPAGPRQPSRYRTPLPPLG